MSTPQQRWNHTHPEVLSHATKKWKSKQIRIEFFLNPQDAEPLLQLPGSRNGNAKRLLLQALRQLY
jgi:hypothetical protein